MGSGKSHWGRIWANKAHLHFHDLDEKMEQVFKMSITDLFEKYGEAKFREFERDHLRKFENINNYIVACGGGTPCFFDNIQWMKEQGTVIYLKANAELIVKRVTNEKEHRPVIKNIGTSALLPFVQQKIEEREPYYLQANIIVNAEDLNEDSLINLFQNKTFTT